MSDNIYKNSLVERLSHLAPLAVPRWMRQSVDKKEKVSGGENRKTKTPASKYHSASNMCICCVVNNSYAL